MLSQLFAGCDVRLRPAPFRFRRVSSLIRNQDDEQSPTIEHEQHR